VSAEGMAAAREEKVVVALVEGACSRVGRQMSTRRKTRRCHRTRARRKQHAASTFLVSSPHFGPGHEPTSLMSGTRHRRTQTGSCCWRRWHRTVQSIRRR